MRVACEGRSTPVRRKQGSIVLFASIALLGACGDDSSGGTTTLPATATTSLPSTVPDTTAATSMPATTSPATTMPGTGAPATTLPTASTAVVAPTTPPVAQPQLAVWPAADVVFATPEAAAKAFLLNVFGVGPLLGPFQAGDLRSGEFEVFASAEGVAIGTPRSVLLMRQLAPSNGWFVLAAVSDVATITTPESMATVPAAPLTVEGVGTGFEATIVVSAFLAGDADTEFDRQVTMAGNFGEVLPYSVTLDLGAAQSGDVVVLLVRGGVGLETDPGDFSAIPVIVA